MSVTPGLDLQQLRAAIQDEYAEVAASPSKGFHFHTGRPLAGLLGYDRSETEALPDSVIGSFAGVGNPFVFGRLHADGRRPDRLQHLRPGLDIHYAATCRGGAAGPVAVSVANRSFLTYPCWTSGTGDDVTAGH